MRAIVTLENQGDRVLADAGHLDPNRVRRATIDALVDTDAVMTLLPQDIVEALGLALDGKIIVTLANDEKIELSRARLLSVELANRQMDTDCLVGPPQCEPLIGQLVLERLDLRGSAETTGLASSGIPVSSLTQVEIVRALAQSRRLSSSRL